MKEQLHRRLKAASATIGVAAPSLQTVTGALAEIGWSATELPAALDDALAVWITINRELEVSPEVRVDRLKPIGDLVNEGMISQVAGAILTQARLIYMHYHATSLTFVPSALVALRQVHMDDIATFRDDIRKFNVIADHVRDAPYNGLRAQLPEAYHIAEFPCIVYLGLLYYQRNLSTEAEKKLFAEYKTTEIKNHIGDISRQKNVKMTAQMLPLADTQSMVTILQTVPADQADLMMCSRPAALVAEVYAILRCLRNPGLWATARMEAERRQIRVQQVEAATALLRRKLNDELTIRRDRVTLILDPARRADELMAIQNWRREMSDLIDGMAPIDDQLPIVDNPVGHDVRATIAATLRAIWDRMSPAPAPAPAPAQQ